MSRNPSTRVERVFEAMALLRNIFGYINQQLSIADRQEDLALIRLTTITYLADWRSALRYQHQVSDIRWVHPFVAKIPEIAKYLLQDGNFQIHSFEGSREAARVKFIGDPRTLLLSDEEHECIDFVLKTYASKSWPELFRLAYSTFPMFTQRPTVPLNLVTLAQQYEEKQRPLLVR